ncbi:TonB-dependent receptor [Filimonas effusa]|uniref:TonB-dependent receptor n=1 Tax=Filimonas effusa TaxID=2508721 RepID=A0A4Q1DBL1_9BACT|nr:TonB-dependent receptor [Filimonas effusa]RXK86700.1 TonB-dependent receptor [Filimonas effusa]
MKKLVILICLFLIFRQLHAQMPHFQLPSGRIYGKIVDNAGKAVNGASVVLLQPTRDSAGGKLRNILVKGVITRSSGEFNFEDIPFQPDLKLKVDATGYISLEETIFLAQAGTGPSPASPGTSAASLPGANMPAMGNTEKDLGKLTLISNANLLEGVIVSSTSKPLMRLDLDKKVFNVEKNLVSAGGTGLDVIQNVPSVNVDIDGNVTIRNSSPQLFIDGRPTTLSLDQIPAASIESVEVITNPSAKYDASGAGAGILNIVLKKDKKKGYNGNARAGIDSRGGLNGGLDLNVRQGKFNVTASGMINQMKDKTTGTTERFNLTTTPQTAISQSNVDKNNGNMLFGKVGLDYFMNNKTSLSLEGVRMHGEFTPTGLLNTYTDSLFLSGKRTSFSQRDANNSRNFNGGGLKLGMKQLFAKEGEELTADINVFGGKNTNNANYFTRYYDQGIGSNIIGTQQQQTIGTGKDRFYTLQTDYVKPLGEKTKLEAGLRASLQHIENVTDNYLYNQVSGKSEKVDAASTNYKNNNNVYAAYLSVSSSIKNFGYQVGLRAERSNYNGDLITTGEHFSNNYPISLFPSVFLSQKLAGDQQLQLSYTRRINRPNFFQLIPFTDYSDSLNITRGNPDLVPEFTNSFELSYNKNFSRSSTFLASVYYRRSNHLITRYLDTTINAISGKQDLVNTYINANSSYTTGAEITLQNNVSNWWDMSTNLNLYNSRINTGNIGGGSSEALWSWFGKMNHNFKLPAGLALQLTGMYQSKTNLPVNNNKGNMGGPPGMQSQSASQGYIKSFYSIDAAIKKTFLKNNAAAVSLSINDIFRSRRTDQYSESDYFTQYYSRLRSPQMVRLNFTYRFGKADLSIFKRKNMNSDNSMQNATQGMQ